MNRFIKAIKKERKLSMNHWRYRLLHATFWCNPKTPAESPLPKFLYTHYCPLFHCTNLLLMLLPLTMCVWLFRGSYKFVLKPVACFALDLVTYLGTTFWTCVLRRKTKEKEESKDTLIQLQLKKLKKHVWEHPQYHQNFKDYNLVYRGEFALLSDKQFLNVFERVAEAHQDWKEAQARRAAFFAKLTHIGEFVMKFVLFGIAIGAIVGLGFLAYYTFPKIPSILESIASFFGYFWSVISGFVSEYGMYSLKCIAGAIGLVAFGVMFFAAAEKVAPSVCDFADHVSGNYIKPSLMFCGKRIWRGLCFVVLPIGRAIDVTGDFIAQVYTDNCPPITIIEEEKIKVGDSVQWIGNIHQHDSIKTVVKINENENNMCIVFLDGHKYGIPIDQIVKVNS